MAYSGGRDSTALLHATLQAAAGFGLQVRALHVHHGLSAHADEWLAHCAAQCERWARRGLPVSFHVAHVELAPRRGDSLEAVARRARYAALRTMALAQGTRLVLLAHHRRDQAETLLLQALRGAGVAGLAGMPAQVERDGVTWARPWLARPREAIEAYLRRHRLRHVDDDSNDEPRFARNRLRLQVWPALVAAFPQAEAALADAATWAAQAAAGIADLAVEDLGRCADADGLDLKAWRTLPPHRAVQALRVWLKAAGARAVKASDVARLMAELPASGAARWALQGGELRRYRGRLSFAPASMAITLLPETELSIARAGRYALPGWGGVLVVKAVREGGIALARLAALQLLPRLRAERFQLAAGRPPRSLKKQFQARAVPEWSRQGPLLHDADGRLLFVPGLGIDARALAAPGERQMALSWQDAGPA